MNKNIESYADSKSFPHVTVALRLQAKRGVTFRVGDTIPFVICTLQSHQLHTSDQPNDEGNASYATRAYHPDEVLDKSSGLELDLQWYKSTQLLPPLIRLCQVTDIDTVRLAELLGLDGTKFRPTGTACDGSGAVGSALGSGTEDWIADLVDNNFTLQQIRSEFKLKCQVCSAGMEYSNLLVKNDQVN